MTPKKLPTDATGRVRDLPPAPEGETWCAQRLPGWRCNCGAQPPLVTHPEVVGAPHQHIPLVTLTRLVGTVGGATYIPLAEAGLGRMDPVWVSPALLARLAGEE
jgi:hypothetical protein